MAKKWLNICINDGALAAWLCLIVSVALLVSGFALPPHGQIDPSVLTATGELLGFYVFAKLPNLVQSIRDGKSLTIKHGATEVTVDSDKDGD